MDHGNAELTMASLFDGIGGFPLAAVRNGITPVWASEIEPFPIRVTKHHFPDMIHMGDITKLDGANLPPVDIICGGSPCQDSQCGWGESWVVRRTLRPIYAPDSNHKGNARCRQKTWKDRRRCSAQVLYMGERALCVEAHKGHYVLKAIMSSKRQLSKKN